MNPYSYGGQQYGFPQQQQQQQQQQSFAGYGGFPQGGQGQGFGATQSGQTLTPYGTFNQPISANVPGMLPLEESYIENILRLNKGKTATVYMTFENNREWNAKVFRGVIEAAGRDHIILSDPQTQMRYLLLMVYLDYITFDEEISYEYPLSGGQQPLVQYQPR